MGRGRLWKRWHERLSVWLGTAGKRLRAVGRNRCDQEGRGFHGYARMRGGSNRGREHQRQKSAQSLKLGWGRGANLTGSSSDLWIDVGFPDSFLLTD